jgi:hypothetical protein
MPNFPRVTALGSQAAAGRGTPRFSPRLPMRANPVLGSEGIELPNSDSRRETAPAATLRALLPTSRPPATVNHVRETVCRLRAVLTLR